jgi:predicted nucleic acid-binding protein
MPVVANAGPLIALARIERLALLPTLYREVVVPPVVYQEITGEIDLPGAEELAQAGWLRAMAARDQLAVQRLLFWLDRGESEAIVLAQEMGATLLIDERRGRAIAATLSLQITGTVGILLAAKELGQVQVVTPLLDALLAAGVRLSPRLYDEAQRQAGER